MLKKIIFLMSLLSAQLFQAIAKQPKFLEEKNNWADQTLQSMTLKEKIGQLFIVAASSHSAQANELLANNILMPHYNMHEKYVAYLIKNYHIGGVIFLGKSEPKKLINLTQKFQNSSKIPLLIALDAEWGLSMRLDKDPSKVVRYPRNMMLGALQDESLIYSIGYEIGLQCAALGVHLNCAPVVDVNNNPHNTVIHDRSFGDDPEKVARLGIVFAQGLQDAGILACAKHFPGHGDTTVDSHFDLPRIQHTIKHLESVELPPFKKIIDQGVSAIMTAHLAVPALEKNPNKPSSMSHEIITKLLKDQMNFHGLIITDGLGMRAITNHYSPGELELEALLAGNDLLLCPLDVPKAVMLIEQALNDGKITHNDLNNRVLKILKAKSWVFEQQKTCKPYMPEEFLIRAEAYDLANKAFHHAITLIQQSPNINLEHVYEPQCIVQIGELPNNTFLKIMKSHGFTTHRYSAQLNKDELEMCLQATRASESILIAVGNITKFAHKQFTIADTTRTLITLLKNQRKKTTVVVFGTPYCIPLFHEADTLLVAYENVSEAQKATANILLKKEYPLGKLPITI